MHGGKLAILAMVLLAAALGTLACWVHYARGRQMMEFWSVDGANLIRHADRVELLLLQPVQDAARDPGPPSDWPATDAGDDQVERLEIQGRSYAVSRALDISRQPGLVHARHALIVDGNFERPEPSSLGQWPFPFAARFSDGSQHVTVAFQPRGRHVTYVETGNAQRLVPHINDGWKLRSQTWGYDRLPKPVPQTGQADPENPPADRRPPIKKPAAPGP